MVLRWQCSSRPLCVLWVFRGLTTLEWKSGFTMCTLLLMRRRRCFSHSDRARPPALVQLSDSRPAAGGAGGGAGAGAGATREASTSAIFPKQPGSETLKRGRKVHRRHVTRTQLAPTTTSSGFSRNRLCSNVARRIVVRCPTSFSNPTVGASLIRMTTEWESISSPRPRPRRIAPLATSAHDGMVRGPPGTHPKASCDGSWYSSEPTYGRHWFSGM